MQRIRKFSALAAICNIISIVLLTVSLATVDWISGDFVGLLGADRGHVSFGLFKVTYLITARQQEETGTASVSSFYDGVFTSGIYYGCVTFIFLSLGTIVLAFILAVLNMCSWSKHKITGPIAMMVVNIVAIIFGAIGDGLFAHLYLNDMDNLLSLELQENVLYTSYKTVNTTIGYSYWLLIGATIVLWGAVILSPLEKRSDRTSIQKAYLSHVTNTVFLPNSPYNSKGDVMMF
ncbi:uncharacterized protein LOC134192248 [Corticium candelabrum]|uniref:uncharacterized protein LOC134192248 n=1 Tax=Corticium candelabrum TaxID=121492 RepID=UPI002E25CCAD|nr:uncharacterized protein LOC134192248 [Corticium candelabrum]